MWEQYKNVTTLVVDVGKTLSFVDTATSISGAGRRTTTRDRRGRRRAKTTLPPSARVLSCDDARAPHVALLYLSVSELSDSGSVHFDESMTEDEIAEISLRAVVASEGHRRHHRSRSNAPCKKSEDGYDGVGKGKKGVGLCRRRRGIVDI